MSGGAAVRALAAMLTIALLLLQARPVAAHPHAFVDAEIDFVFDDQGALVTLDITWRYDAFKTLYILGELGIDPGPDGALTPQDHKKLFDDERKWLDEFEGAAYLSIAGAPRPLSKARDLDVRLVDGRLVVHFLRDLERPAALARQSAELAVYEATYFFAYTVGRAPKLHGPHGACTAQVVRFNPDEQAKALQAKLAALRREETPENANVGSFFADRILLTCG